MIVEKLAAELEDVPQVASFWTSIEAKLAAGVTRSLKSRPLEGRKVALRIHEAVREDLMLPGRALLFFLYREYRRDDAVAMLYDWKTLWKSTCRAVTVDLFRFGSPGTTLNWASPSL